MNKIGGETGEGGKDEAAEVGGKMKAKGGSTRGRRGSAREKEGKRELG
jgi:hypothetical protein